MQKVDDPLNQQRAISVHDS
ncbi:jg12030, partial [Pararge aegeria aegeria]